MGVVDWADRIDEGSVTVTGVDWAGGAAAAAAWVEAAAASSEESMTSRRTLRLNEPISSFSSANSVWSVSTARVTRRGFFSS